MLNAALRTNSELSTDQGTDQDQDRRIDSAEQSPADFDRYLDQSEGEAEISENDIISGCWELNGNSQNESILTNDSDGIYTGD